MKKNEEEDNIPTFYDITTERDLQEVEYFGGDRRRSGREQLDVPTKESTNLMWNRPKVSHTARTFTCRITSSG